MYLKYVCELPATQAAESGILEHSCQERDTTQTSSSEQGVIRQWSCLQLECGNSLGPSWRVKGETPEALGNFITILA